MKIESINDVFKIIVEEISVAEKYIKEHEPNVKAMKEHISDKKTFINKVSNMTLEEQNDVVRIFNKNINGSKLEKVV